MKAALLFLGTLCLITHTRGQLDKEKKYDLEKFIEEIFPIQHIDADYASLYENLLLRLSNPIDLNRITDDQLRSLFILSENQIRNFMAYRTKQQYLLSKYELQTIPGFDTRTIKRLSPLVTVHPIDQQFRSTIKRIFHEKNNYLIVRVKRTLEDKKGYLNQNTKPPAYEGSPYQVYTRFRVARSEDFSIGFTLEKDAGESFKWVPSKSIFGFDYASAHVQMLNKGIVKNILLGDYEAQFGQGLILGGGFSAGKGAEPVTTVRKGNIGFIPYTSANESGFFRGVALSLQPIKKIIIHNFFSRIGRDGNIISQNTGTTLTSITGTGFHRTASEIENRKSFHEINYGSVLTYKKHNLEAGAIVHTTHLSIPLQSTLRPYNQFAFRGNKNINLGLFINYSRNNISLFGEAATSIHQGTAYLAGMACSLSPKFDLSILHRRYPENFYTFYGNAFSENTTPQNETGYYIGWKYTTNKRYRWTGYIDFFTFPWLRYDSYSPSKGKEWLIRFVGDPSKKLSFFIQARGEYKTANIPSSPHLFPTGEGIKHNYWINCQYTISPNITLRSRIQYSTYRLAAQKTDGFALIQDINVKIGRFSLSLRHAFFDTDDYENRQYTYEKNVWLAYALPAYYDVGIRNYALLQYTINKKITVWIRWERTHYTRRSTIGSGNETLMGNAKNDITFQARIKF